MLGFDRSIFFLMYKKKIIPDIRTIEVNQFTYEEQGQKMLNKFDEYDIDATETTLNFSGSMTVSLGEIFGFDFLSDVSGNAKKTFSISYNIETNEFFVEISYRDGEYLINTIKERGEPIVDEERDDAYMEIDGQRVYFSEAFDINSLDNCIALVDDAAVVAVGLVVVAAVLLYVVCVPTARTTVITTLQTITTTVVEAVKSFWSWLTSWVTRTTTTTVVQTTVATVYTPSLVLNNEKVETQEMTKEMIDKLPQGAYFLCFADSSNGKIYMSIVQITQSVAIGIMNTVILVPCIGKPSEQMVASIFSLNETHIFLVMDIVGYSVRTPRWYPENHGIGKGYLWHYHSLSEIKVGSVYYAPHAFFGLPV